MPDNDPPGEKYAETLVETFTKFKSQPTVKVVSIADHASITGLENFPKGGDIVDLCEILDSKTIRDLKRRFKGEKETLEKTLNAMIEQGILVHIELPKTGPGRGREVYRVAAEH